MLETNAQISEAICLAPKIYVSNFGIANKLWSDCLKHSRIETFSHISALPFLENEDKDDFVLNAMKNELTSKGVRPDKGVAARWYNVSKIFESTAGDVWLHRADDDIWWTISLPETHTVSFHASHAPEAKDGDQVFHTTKPTLPWRRHDLAGRRLSWKAAHPKARDFLATEATMQAISRPEYETYARAMLLGNDLSTWHTKPAWEKALEDAGKGEASILNAVQMTAARMADTAANTAKNANGQTVLTVLKNKEMMFASTYALELHVLVLIERQKGLCAISSLPLQ